MGLCLSFLLSIVVVKAQDHYQAEINYLKAASPSRLGPMSFTHYFPDTSLDNFHEFMPRSTNGLFGLPSAPLRFETQFQPTGFTFFNAPYQATVAPMYFKTKGPFIDIKAFSPPNKGFQLLNFLYTQNLTEQLNLSVRLDRMNSPGYYVRESAFMQRLMITSHYAHPQQRFGISLYYYGGQNRHAENGGLKDIRLNDSTAQLLKNILDMQLSAARRDFVERKAHVNTYWRLGGRDSIGAHYLQFRSTFSSSQYQYTDNGLTQDNYYANIYRDSANTQDSASHINLRHNLGYAFRKENLQLGVGAMHEFARVWQWRDSVFSNLGLYAESSWHHSDSGRVTSYGQAELEWILQGNNAGNYKFTGKHTLVKNRDKGRYFSFYGGAGQRNADYIYYRWNSNHFTYLQSLKKISELKTEVTYAHQKDIKITAQYLSTGNFVYFDQNALPVQFTGVINNTSLRLQLAHTWFKHWRGTLDYTRQITSNRGLERVPPSITKIGTYFYGQYYKNTLEIQTGLELTLIESYQALAYMPATQVFYLQNQYTGTYPYVDYVLNFHLRPVTLSVVLRNTLQGFVGHNYSITPGYYQPDRSVWLALRWMFFD